MRRLPPNQVAQSLAGIGKLIEDEAFKQQLFDQVDQPLEEETDTATGKKFLKHEYNRDGDSYRSPWSNTYYPASPDATFFPSEQLLQLE
jgi:capping protein beta